MGQSITVVLTFVPAEGDIDLYMHRESGQVFGVSGSVDDTESYTFTGEGEFVYAEARLQDNSACVLYTLTTQWFHRAFFRRVSGPSLEWVEGRSRGRRWI